MFVSLACALSTVKRTQDFRCWSMLVDKNGICFYNTRVMKAVNDVNAVKSPFYYLSKYRAELMGLSIVWVLWFHADFQFEFIQVDFLRKIVFFIQEMAVFAVDFFMLVGGMGVFCSLQKNTTGAFYKNRLKRILPVWWLFLVIDIILGALSVEAPLSLLEVLTNATFLSYWLNFANAGNWYVYAIMLFYLVSPLFYFALRKARFSRWMYVALIVAAFGLSFCFFTHPKLIVFARLPIYLLGFLFAGRRDYQRMTKRNWIICLCCCIAGLLIYYLVTGRLIWYLWTYGLWWYPFFILTPSLSLLMDGFFERLQRGTAPLRKVMRALGNASLEILLTSDILMFKWIGLREMFPCSTELATLFLMIISILVGLLIHAGIEAVKKRVWRVLVR